MRVLINQLAARGRKTGVGHYTHQLIQALRRQTGEVRISTFPGGPLWPATNAFAYCTPWLKRFSATARHKWYWAALLGLPYLASCALYQCARVPFRYYFESLFASDRFDLYHEPNFLPFPSSLPTIITLHDLSVLLYPQWHPPARVAAFEAKFHQGLKQCAHVITVSEFVRRQALQHLSLPPERVTCVYNGVAAHFRPLPMAEVTATLQQLQLQPGYLLCLGTIEPRKNILMLMRAYCALPASLRERCPLLLVGQWGWKTEEVADFYEREGRHRGVRYLDYVADRFLPALYNGARALVYPSLYEGFGLPPVEMMACGGAVLASKAEALVEIVGRQAHLTDAHDVDGWRQALARVIEDEDWRQTLRQGATLVAGNFSWERAAADTLQVYRRLTTSENIRAAA